MKESIEYCNPGTVEYVKGKWSLGIQQYLSYISEDTGISIYDLLGKLNVELGTDEDKIGLWCSITSDRAYEAFLYKTDENDEYVESSFDDVAIVKTLVKQTLEDIDEA